MELLGVVGGGGAREILRLFKGLLGLLLTTLALADVAGTFLFAAAASETSCATTSLGVFKTFISTEVGGA